MLTVFVILSFVCYRIVRFIREDTLIDAQRQWLLSKILGRPYVENEIYVVDPPAAWRQKLVELLTCPYCLGVWVSAGAVALASFTWSVPQPFWMWLAVSAGLLAVYHYIED